MINHSPPDILTIRAAVRRARDDGYPVAEHALRRWIHQGEIPVRHAGNRQLLYYPTLLAYLRHANYCLVENEVCNEKN